MKNILLLTSFLLLVLPSCSHLLPKPECFKDSAKLVDHVIDHSDEFVLQERLEEDALTFIRVASQTSSCPIEFGFKLRPNIVALAKIYLSGSLNLNAIFSVSIASNVDYTLKESEKRKIIDALGKRVLLLFAENAGDRISESKGSEVLQDFIEKVKEYKDELSK